MSTSAKKQRAADEIKSVVVVVHKFHVAFPSAVFLGALAPFLDPRDLTSIFAVCKTLSSGSLSMSCFKRATLKALLMAFLKYWDLPAPPLSMPPSEELFNSKQQAIDLLLRKRYVIHRICKDHFKDMNLALTGVEACDGDYQPLACVCVASALCPLCCDCGALAKTVDF